MEYAALSWLGPMELFIILAIVMLLFGATQIPRLMRGMGQGIHEFKKGLEDGDKPESKEPQDEKKTDSEKDSAS